MAYKYAIFYLIAFAHGLAISFWICSTEDLEGRPSIRHCEMNKSTKLSLCFICLAPLNDMIHTNLRCQINIPIGTSELCFQR